MFNPAHLYKIGIYRWLVCSVTISLWLRYHIILSCIHYAYQRSIFYNKLRTYLTSRTIQLNQSVNDNPMYEGEVQPHRTCDRYLWE